MQKRLRNLQQALLPANPERLLHEPYNSPLGVDYNVARLEAWLGIKSDRNIVSASSAKSRSTARAPPSNKSESTSHMNPKLSTFGRPTQLAKPQPLPGVDAENEGLRDTLQLPHVEESVPEFPRFRSASQCMNKETENSLQAAEEVATMPLASHSPALKLSFASVQLIPLPCMPTI